MVGALAVAGGLGATLIVRAWPTHGRGEHRTHHAVDVQPPIAPPAAPPTEEQFQGSPVLAEPSERIEPQPAPSVSVARPLMVTEAPAATPLPSAMPAAASSAPAEAPAAPTRAKPRRVPFSALSNWLEPGLCSDSRGAAAVRERLTESFRVIDDGERGQLHLDPRLPEGSEVPVLALMDRARGAVARGLGLSPPAPTVYVYFDVQLLKSAACINEDVVAFYDGELHLVLGRADLLASVVHEYMHHALFSSGLMGPAWAQEGIAMTVAGETWWRRPELLQALLQLPFSADQLDRTIAYKLPSAQAVSFYVQSALTVQCLQAKRGWTLQQLADTLRAGNTSDSLSYDLPELEQSSFLSDCIAELAHR